MKHPEFRRQHGHQQRRKHQETAQQHTVAQRQHEEAQRKPGAAEADVIRQIKQHPVKTDARVEPPLVRERGLLEIAAEFQHQQRREQHHQNVIPRLSGGTEKRDVNDAQERHQQRKQSGAKEHHADAMEHIEAEGSDHGKRQTRRERIRAEELEASRCNIKLQPALHRRQHPRVCVMAVGGLHEQLFPVEGPRNPHAAFGHQPAPVGRRRLVPPEGNPVEPPEQQNGRDSNKQQRQRLFHDNDMEAILNEC